MQGKPNENMQETCLRAEDIEIAWREAFTPYQLLDS